MIPNDALYQNQWHLQSIGDIQTIWNEYSGQGVHVGVYDTGIDYTHPDLVQNYDASRHVVINGVVHDPRPNDNSVGANVNYHGTACAGLIGARGNNGIGVVGTGWGSSLTGVNIFDSQGSAYIDTPGRAGFLSAVRQMKNFDLTSNSWAKTPEFYASQNLNDPTSLRADIDAYYAEASAQGRGGLGTVIVQAAGNDYAEAQGDGLNVSRYTVTVAAARQDGFASSYSNNGACILLTAPGSEVAGSIVTTDRSGSPGASTGDYSSTFAGTSAATPIVSGVVALMLQANPNLGWRDVQTILALSSTHTGSAIGASTLGANEDGWSSPSDGTWQIDAADNYNGGGMHYSVDYGYGMLDAYNAVRMAEAWALFSPTAQTSANEQSFSTGNLTVTGNTVIADGSYLDVSVNVSASMLLEHADITLTFTHGDFRDLDIYAYSAEGSWALLHRGGDTLGPSDVAANGLAWTFGVDSLRGEATAGTWYIRFIDRSSDGVSGTVSKIKFDVYGTATTADDVYHYTDEFADLSGQNAARKTLNDTDGGTDWIDAAAVKSACLVELTAGATMTIAGTPITMGSGLIENVTTGDGNDVITANTATNTLAGGRGADTYRVDAAADRVIERAGQGSDTLIASASYVLAAGQSVESVLAANKTGTAAINLTGNDLANIVQGTNGANTLSGGGGADQLSGFNGSDGYIVDNAGDRVFEAAGGGTDRLFAGVSYVLAAGQQIETLATTSAAGTGAINLTGNETVQTLTGNAGANGLDGKGGADTLQGLSGNDTYYVDNASDKVVEAAGGGTDRLFASVGYVLAAGQEVETLATTSSAGTGAINLTGNEKVQTIFGNAGANRLDGKAGADTLSGLSGNDIYTVDHAGDRVVEAAGGGTDDRVVASVSYALATGQQVEVLGTTSSAGTGSINLTGNELAQAVIGNAGANRLDGKAGADTLTGLGGQDIFLFTTAPSTGDRVADFVVADDTMHLSRSVFTVLPAGSLSSSAFKDLGVSGATVDADDRILYNRTTGVLTYDADGSSGGTAVQFAILTNKALLTFQDFQVV